MTAELFDLVAKLTVGEKSAYKKAVLGTSCLNPTIIK